MINNLSFCAIKRVFIADDSDTSRIKNKKVIEKIVKNDDEIEFIEAATYQGSINAINIIKNIDLIVTDGSMDGGYFDELLSDLSPHSADTRDIGRVFNGTCDGIGVAKKACEKMDPKKIIMVSGGGEYRSSVEKLGATFISKTRGYEKDLENAAALALYGELPQKHTNEEHAEKTPVKEKPFFLTKIFRKLVRKI